MKETVSGIMLTLLLVSILALAFNIQPVKAQGIIYIKADGSIDPPTAPIERFGELYVLTDNISSRDDGIVIQRSNITLDGAGYLLQGSSVNITVGIALWINNVKIKNMKIEGFSYGFYLGSVNYNTISGCSVAINVCGIRLFGASHNNITGNSITENTNVGIGLSDGSSYNNIFGNNITGNAYYGGISLYTLCEYNSIFDNNISDNSFGIDFVISECDSNNIFRNNIVNNHFGIRASWSSYGKFYHNSFINNTYHVAGAGWNFWNNDYPIGGNYWSNYTGTDLYRGPYQNETGSDGIGDIPHIIVEDVKDNYPLMKPYGGPRDIGIVAVTPNKPVVGQGYRVRINVTVVNYGFYLRSEVFNASVYANETLIGFLADIQVASRNSVTLTFAWYTTGFVKGDYIMSAYASPVLGETETADNRKQDGSVRVAMPGDFNGGGTIDGADLFILLRAWCTSPPRDPRADANDDGAVDGADFFILLQNWGAVDP